MALVVLSVVEQRLDAVRAVLAGESVVEVAARYRVARSTVHRWIGRYLEGSVAGLADRSHSPRWCPHQVQPGLPRVFRTVEFVLFHAASCSFEYSLRTSCGVR